MNLQEKIQSRQAVVTVIGMGYVGLPLAVAFAEAGFLVTGIDIDEDRVEAINRCESYVSDVPSDRLASFVIPQPAATPRRHAAHDADGNHETRARQSAALSQVGQLSATTDFDAIAEADAVIICVPTPLDENKNPNMSHIIVVAEEVSQRLHQDMLVVLESTTYPGTTEEVILPCLEKSSWARPRKEIEKPSVGTNGIVGNGATAATDVVSTFPPGKSINGQGISGRKYIVGRDFFLAYSPERIDPGRIDYTILTTPKVLGGTTPKCTEIAHALYSTIIERLVPVSSPRVAEMVKLLENTFRAVNIALVNEVAIMCDRLELDVWEVIEAAKTKPFGFMSFYPGPGLGGHCIPIDPQYLAWKLRTLNYNARFIQLAAEINFGMPHFVLDRINDALNDERKSLNGSSVLILGVAYKADVGDLRESPALELIRLLLDKGANVSYHDPFVRNVHINEQEMTSVALDQETLQAANCVVITTDHSSYNWEKVVENSKLIIDTRNATKDVAACSTRIVML